MGKEIDGGGTPNRKGKEGKGTEEGGGGCTFFRGRSKRKHGRGNRRGWRGRVQREKEGRSGGGKGKEIVTYDGEEKGVDHGGPESKREGRGKGKNRQKNPPSSGGESVLMTGVKKKTIHKGRGGLIKGKV